MTAHTPGPWVACPPTHTGQWFISAPLVAIAGMLPAKQEANAARIVACVNFCEGVATEDFTGPSALNLRETIIELQTFSEGWRQLRNELTAARAQRDELAAALRSAASQLEARVDPLQVAQQLRSMIAKAQP